MVDEIYERMTNRADPVLQPAHEPAEAAPDAGLGLVLADVSTNLLAGVMGAVAADPFNGEADLPQLSETLQMEVDELFPITETLQLFGFAEVAKGDIRITDAGRRFVDSDVDTRKRMFAEHLRAHVPIALLIRRVLDERPTHRAPYRRFAEELEDFMSEEFADETLSAVITWGRYAELFAYDEQAQAFSLEDPA